MFLENLGGDDREAVAEVLHEIAREVESGCIVICDARLERTIGEAFGGSYGQMETRLSLEFLSTGQHDDDLLVSLE